MISFPKLSFSKKYLSILFGLLFLCLTPGMASAQSPGVEYTITLEGQTFHVSMRPDFAPSGTAQTLTAQITLKVPHDTVDPFTVNNLFNAIPGVTWSLTSRIDAPTEDPNADYLSFTASINNSLALLANRPANEEFLVFTFDNTAACFGEVAIMDNDEDFNDLPNSAGTNPGNTIEVFDIPNGISADLYFANFTTITADCTKSDLEITIGPPAPNFVVGVTSTVPITVANIGSAPSGPITVTVPVPPGITTPAAFTDGPWTCTATSTLVTCTSAGPINPGEDSNLGIPMTPGPTTIDTTVPLTAEVGTTNDNNPANDTDGPLNVPVVGAPELVVIIGDPTPELVAGVTSNVPVTVANIGTADTSGPITVTLEIPPNVSVPPTFTDGPWECTSTGSVAAGYTITCVSDGPINDGEDSVFNVPLTPLAPMPELPVVPNVETPGQEPDPAPAPVDLGPVEGAPELVVTIGDPTPELVVGVTSNVPVTVENIGNIPTSGPITVTLDIPPDVQVPPTFTDGPWDCISTGSVAAGYTVTCVSDGPINDGEDSVFNVPLTPLAPMPELPIDPTVTTPNPVDPTGPPLVTDPGPTDLGPVEGLPELVVTIGDPTPELVVGVTSNVPVTVANVGDAPTSGPITVTLDIPPDVQVPPTFTDGPWECTSTGSVAAGYTVTCVSDGPINDGEDSVFNVPLTPLVPMPELPIDPEVTTPNPTDPTGPPLVTDPGPADLGPVEGLPELVITVGDPTPELVKGVESSVPVTVENIGDATTTGPITATLTTPPNVSVPPTFTDGPWECTSTGSVAAGYTVTCVSDGPLAPGEESVFNVPLTPLETMPELIVDPEVTTEHPVPGEPPLVTAPGPADLGPVEGLPELVITVGDPTPELAQGMTSTVPVTVANIGDATTTGPITATLTTPPNVSVPPTFTDGPWECTSTGSVAAGYTVTCVSDGPLAPGEESVFNVPLTPLQPMPELIVDPEVTTDHPVPGEPPLVTDPGPVDLGPVAETLLPLPIKVFLSGPYVASAGLMRDNLRMQSFIPTTEPYTGMPGFTHLNGGGVNGGGGEIVNSSIFSVTGDNAIVDWVFVELRDSAAMGTVVATRAALVQRDGDVVGLDGVTVLHVPYSFNNQNRFVSVRHRNHLGVMSANTVLITIATPLTDFTISATPVFGTNPMKVIGNVRVLWSGNTNVNKAVIAAGPLNDVNPVLIKVLGDPENFNFAANYIVYGYWPTDVSMDGRTIAAGPNNDLNPILANVYSHPVNTTLAANYIILQQLP